MQSLSSSLLDVIIYSLLGVQGSVYWSYPQRKQVARAVLVGSPAADVPSC